MFLSHIDSRAATVFGVTVAHDHTTNNPRDSCIAAKPHRERTAGTARVHPHPYRLPKGVAARDARAALALRGVAPVFVARARILAAHDDHAA